MQYLLWPSVSKGLLLKVRSTLASIAGGSSFRCSLWLTHIYITNITRRYRVGPCKNTIYNGTPVFQAILLIKVVHKDLPVLVSAANP